MKKIAIIVLIVLLIGGIIIFFSTRKKTDKRNKGLTNEELLAVIKTTKHLNDEQREQAKKAVESGLYVPADIHDKGVPVPLILAQMYLISTTNPGWYAKIKDDATKNNLPLMNMLAETAAYQLHDMSQVWWLRVQRDERLKGNPSTLPPLK